MSNPDESARSDSPAASARVSEYWEGQFEKNRVDNSLWTNNLIVARHIYRLISGGSEEHWLPWFFNHYLDNGIFLERSLSVCCGDGAHELALANTGRVRFIHGFDISEGAIAQANVTFQNAAIPIGSYAFEVADANNLQWEGQFDLLLSTGALHHVTNLEKLFSKLSNLLSVNGYFVVLEYVGPNRFQWRDTQLSVINGILRQLDPRYLRENTRIELSRPSVEAMMAIDPSEAVRSEDVLGLLPNYFTVEYLRNFNGTVMHPLYPLLNASLTNANTADFDSIVRMILLMEDTMICENLLPSDFVFAICRNKKLVEAGNSPEGRRRSRERRFAGSIDVFDRRFVVGWAADLKAEAPVIADVYIDDRLQGTVPCDGFRQDLQDAGYGDGRKGFRLELIAPPPFSRHQVARLVVAGSTEVIATRPYQRQ